jgi:hypothetical protein
MKKNKDEIKKISKEYLKNHPLSHASKKLILDLTDAEKIKTYGKNSTKLQLIKLIDSHLQSISNWNVIVNNGKGTYNEDLQKLVDKYVNKSNKK